MIYHEINFDGLVGPTHHYAGLAFGNVASMAHKLSISNPKQAALEGLAKMKFLADLGLKQAVLPPQQRPHLPTLRRLGFTGTDPQILEQVHRHAPQLLAAVSSASSMWAANAATVSPSSDTADHRVHFTPANLISNFHRSIEAPMTTRILRTIFADESRFIVHDPLPAAVHFADEGAANHMRLCARAGIDQAGMEIFIYGRRAFDGNDSSSFKFPARQTYEACTAIARNHLLHPDHVLFLRQNPAAIDAGAFHNDVLAVGNENILLHHAAAYVDLDFTKAMESRGIETFPADMPLEDAIKSYIFNSQFVTLPDGSRALIAPTESRDVPSAKAYIDLLVSSGAVQAVHFVDVRQSMANGGGPACLRLRVILGDDELSRLSGNILLTEALHQQIKAWIEKHYRDRLHADDLRDPKLLEESLTALDELTRILSLGAVFEFQQ